MKEVNVGATTLDGSLFSRSLDFSPLEHNTEQPRSRDL